MDLNASFQCDVLIKGKESTSHVTHMPRADVNVVQPFFSAVHSNLVQNVTVSNMQVYSCKVPTYVKFKTAAPPLPRR